MLEPDRIIRLRIVLVRTGLSRFTVYRKIDQGTFPAQIKISIHARMAGVRHQPMDRRSRIMEAEAGGR